MDEQSRTERRHERIIAAYFAMWPARDFTRFDQLFAPGCRYEECYGPIYDGLDELHGWIDDMLAQQVVASWDIHEFIHAHDPHTVTVTWTFVDDRSGFDGVSIIHFDDDGCIDRIREFEATRERTHPQRAGR